MTTLPREIAPDPALEDRVVSTLVASGLVRRRSAWRAWAVAAAVLLAVGLGTTLLHPGRTLGAGQTYVILLYEDSTYRPAPPGQNGERVAVLSRWADSLATHGEFERAGRVIGAGELGGLFLVRAADDSVAARIAASCPFHQWGGRVEIHRFER